MRSWHILEFGGAQLPSTWAPWGLRPLEPKRGYEEDSPGLFGGSDDSRDRYFGGSATRPQFIPLQSLFPTLPYCMQPYTCSPWPGVTEAWVPFLINFNPFHSTITPPCLLRPLQAPLPWKSVIPLVVPSGLNRSVFLWVPRPRDGGGRTEVLIPTENGQANAGTHLRKGLGFTDRPGFKF